MKRCTDCGLGFTSEAWRCPGCGHEPLSIAGHLAFSPQLAEDSSGFDAAYFPELAAVEESSFWYNARNRLIVWALREYFPDAQKVLEIGCGTGYVLSALRSAFPQMTLSGSEIFTAGLTEAARRVPDISLFQMDAQKMPFDREFDVIGAFDVIEHIENDDAVLAEMFRSVVPGGGLLLTVPQHPWLWSSCDEFAHHCRRYRAGELKEKVKRAGFTVTFASSFVSLLLPLMMLARLRRRRSVNSESVAGWLNAALQSVMDAERALIRGGLSLPLGGSLLLVAQRPKSM
jgi:ubiquinone/menaquinone biosynthesis C-methylase UbiE